VVELCLHPKEVSVNSKWKTALLFILLIVAIIYIGMFVPHSSPIRYWGSDVLLTALVYLEIVTTFGVKSVRGMLIVALVAFLGASVFEFLSLLHVPGLFLLNGTFDPADFAAYTVGALGGIGLDISLLRRDE
jgi:hypothetical protein